MDHSGIRPVTGDRDAGSPQEQRFRCPGMSEMSSNNRVNSAVDMAPIQRFPQWCTERDRAEQRLGRECAHHVFRSRISQLLPQIVTHGSWHDASRKQARLDHRRDDETVFRSDEFPTHNCVRSCRFWSVRGSSHCYTSFRDACDSAPGSWHRRCSRHRRDIRSHVVRTTVAIDRSGAGYVNEAGCPCPTTAR